MLDLSSNSSLSLSLSLDSFTLFNSEQRTKSIFDKYALCIHDFSRVEIEIIIKFQQHSPKANKKAKKHAEMLRAWHMRCGIFGVMCLGLVWLGLVRNKFF